MTGFDLKASIEACARQDTEGCVKCWEDLDRYRSILAAVRPALIVECGTFSGKSALWLADVGNCSVITVDVADQVDDDVRAAWAGRIVQVVSPSTDRGTVAAIGAGVAAADGPVMVILDSDHSGPHVLNEMRAYSRFVTPGSFMVVEDTILRWLDPKERSFYNGDPMDAVEEWLSTEVGWVIDDEIQGMHPVTIHPSGWLRRAG